MGGYFPFFTENRPQKHKNHAILHTSQANGGLEPPPALPPGYARAPPCQRTVPVPLQTSVPYLRTVPVPLQKKRTVQTYRTS